MNAVLEKIEKIGIVPVVVLNDAKDAEPLAKALCNGGLPCAEVTFRTEAAEESIRIMTEKFPEMEKALEMGLDVVKFFPAEPAGGLKMIKAVAAPYTTLKFMPTGGINLGNVEEYLKYDRILACGGSWMVKGDLVSAGKFDEIEKMTKDAAELVKRIRA